MDAVERETVQRPNFCPECGAQIGGDDLFCGGCGGTVDAGVPSASVPHSSSVSPATSLREGDVISTDVQKGFSKEAFAAALTLGSIWVFLNIKRGSLRRGWLTLIAALPATVIVWAWLSTVLHTFTEPFFAIVNRSHTMELVTFWVVVRIFASLPMALAAGKDSNFWRRDQQLLRNVGIATITLLALVLLLDRATAGGRRSEAIGLLKGKVVPLPIFLGRSTNNPHLGFWKVMIRGPHIGASAPLEFLVSDTAHPLGQDVANSPVPLADAKPNEPYYWGEGILTFSTMGSHPQYEMKIDGQTMAKGDLQAEALVQ
jgi:hypothetical protein